MKTINYEDWIKSSEESRKVSVEILSRFDLTRLKRKPRDPEEEKWLRERGLESKFQIE